MSRPKTLSEPIARTSFYLSRSEQLLLNQASIAQGTNKTGIIREALKLYVDTLNLQNVA